MINRKSNSDEGAPSETAINEILLKPVSYSGVSAAQTINQQVLSQPNSPRKNFDMQENSENKNGTDKKKEFAN